MTTSPRILVLYASTHGQTRRIAERVAATLGEEGAEAELRDATDLPDDLAPERYAAIVIGASVHGGHHQGEVAEFVERHRELLGSVPSAFFSVSLTAADDDEEARATTRKYVADFLEKTGWQPAIAESFAGAILYSHYGIFERTLMRLIMRHQGHGDIKYDREFTSWDAVDRFAREFASLVAERSATQPARGAHDRR